MSTGKGTKSIRKSQQGNDIIPSVGFLNTLAKHKATLGQTVINISSLTVPPEATALGFVQPSGGTLAAIDLQRFKNNVQVSSSFRGLMDNPLDYQITGTQQITLQVAALESEIFTISMQARPRVGTTLVAAQPRVQSYTLPVGSTDIPVGVAYTVNAQPGNDSGDFMVFVDKVLMQRNTSNSAPGSGIEGDYQEIAGFVRMNSIDFTNDRRVTLVWVGALLDNPDSSYSIIQTVASQIDAMIPTLAALAGVPESTFQGAPNDPALLAFANRVTDLENRLNNVAYNNYDYVEYGGGVRQASNRIFPTNQLANMAQGAFDVSTFASAGELKCVKAGWYTFKAKIQMNALGTSSITRNNSVAVNGANTDVLESLVPVTATEHGISWTGYIAANTIVSFNCSAALSGNTNTQMFFASYLGTKAPTTI